MAGADYTKCAVCSKRCFYSGNIDWDDTDVGEVKATCTECTKKGYSVRIIRNNRITRYGEGRGHTGK